MASEIRVNKLNSQTGVGTITLSPTGVDISGITTAETLKATTGIVTTLTATTGIVTSLEATTGDITTLRAPTGIVTSLEATTGDITTLRAPTGIVTTFVTNTAKVGAAVTITESGIEASGIGITVANINGGAIGGRRNLVINGSMKVAQRGTSYTGTNAYHTVDRFRTFYGTQDASQTYTQNTLSSSDSPYTEGHRHYFRVQNGDQISGAQAGSYVIIQNRIEAQDVANSGWNYTDPNSSITLQFWLRASVSQDYMITVESSDGTNKAYVFLVSLTANTWTKVIRTLPGHADLTFNNDTGIGLKLGWYPYIGTTYSGSSTTLNDWVTMTNPYRRTMTTTWFTTNDSTFDITGVQLEVGSQATPFEHRSFGEELSLCQRYYFVTGAYAHGGSSFHPNGAALAEAYGSARFPTSMRANPTIVLRDANGNTDGKVTQWGAAHDLACTASYISTTGFNKINRSSGTFNNTTNWVISAGYTADAEI